MYTEPYGQFDLNVSYQWGDNLTLQAEAINLTDEIQRIHGRTDTEALFVTQTGPRYMIGARYKFGAVTTQQSPRLREVPQAREAEEPLVAQPAALSLR